MKQRIELLEFFLDKLPLPKVESLEESQDFSDFSGGYTNSSAGQGLSGRRECETRFVTQESLESTISESNRYKKIFLGVQRSKRGRRQSISKVWRRCGQRRFNERLTQE